MKSNYLLIPAVVVLIISSCNLIARKLLGIKQPGIESTQSITAFMQKNGLNSEYCYYIDSIASYKFWKENEEKRVTSLAIFNGSGQFLKRLGANECSGTLAKTLETIDLSNLKPVIITSDNLDNILQKFRRVDNTKTVVTDFKSDEFVVTIFWMKCFGSLSFKDDVVEWTKELKKNQFGSNIRILYLNTDMHESWGIKSKDDERRIVFDF